MATAEVEIRNIQAPIGYQDPAEEMFVPPKTNEDDKVNRFLFTAANKITPTIARERPHMRFGGLNVFNPCLNQSKDFIRRGRIVPLLLNQHIPIPAEDSGDGNGYFEVPFVDMVGGLNVPNPFGDTGGMVTTFAYPGQQIQYILESSPNVDVASGMRTGIVEITSLKGHDYKLEDIGNGLRADKDLWKIQKAIFPTYPDLPYAIRPFIDLVRAAIDANTGLIRTVAEEMLPACLQWEAWMIRFIEETHQNMGQAAVKGYSSPYVEMDLIVLSQLEMQRQDEHFKRTAQIQAAQQQSQPKMTHEEYMAMKAEVLADLRAEQAVAPAPFIYVPDAFKPNANDPSLCAICGFAKINKHAHPDSLQVAEEAAKAKDKK